MATGTTTIDFGAAPGSIDTTKTITGQTGIASGSHVSAFMMWESSADHTDDEHLVVSVELRCGNIVGGTGFDIRARSNIGPLVGLWSVRWVWV